MSQLRIFCTITAKNGERVPLEISAESTPTELRAAVAGATKIPLGTLRLIYRGKMIKDETTTKVVDTYKLEADCVLHCMGQPVEGARPAEPAAAPVASMPPTAASAAVPSVASPAATVTPAPPASAPVDVLSEALRGLRTSNSPEVYKTAVTTLSKILSNIAENPMEEKYRKVKKQNAAFQKRLGGLPGGDAAMRAAGFALGEDAGAPVYQLVPSPEAWPKLMAARAAVDAAATEAKRTPVPPVAPMAPIPAFGGMPPTMPGMPANMAEAMNDPRMQAGMERMMNNPEGLRAMMQNPMVQQMIMNDPNLPPHMRESMRQMVNNPAMMEQLSNMMSDPAQMERMRTMMGRGGGMPAPPAGGTNPPPAARGAPSRASDQDQTEEEMIAEAIRRSLEEG